MVVDSEMQVGGIDDGYKTYMLGFQVTVILGDALNMNSPTD